MREAAFFPAPAFRRRDPAEARGLETHQAITREQLELTTRRRELHRLATGGINLLVPLAVSDRVIGLIALPIKPGGELYQLHEIQLLTIVAGQVAMQLVNTRLYEEQVTKQKLEEEMRLARAIQSRLLPADIPTFDGIQIDADDVTLDLDGFTLGGAVGLAMIEAGEPINKAYVEEGDWDEASELVTGKRTPVKHVLAAGLGMRDADRETQESVLQEAILNQLPRVERGMAVLAVLGAIAPLLGHADIRLHEAAYLEIARAPYNEIRRIATEGPIETVRGMLDEPRYLEWRSLAILMLAESQRSADRAQIRKAFEDKQRLGSLFNLAAWATAYLAIEGEDGLERIRRWYLTQPERSREELKEIVKALSVYASAVAPFREPVAAAYRALLETHPSLAPDVSRDLITWRRWDFVEQIRGIRAAIEAGNFDAWARESVAPRLAVTPVTTPISSPRSLMTTLPAIRPAST